jgi:OOP family OmpA-OmpF porin
MLLRPGLDAQAQIPLNRWWSDVFNRQENNMKRTDKGFISSFRLHALALSLALAGNTALAQDSGWYGALGIGGSETDIDAAGISRAVGANGFGTRVFSRDDTDFAWKIAGGYDFNPNFALEFSYFDLGDFTYDTTLMPVVGTHSGKASVDGFALDLVGTLPLQGNFSLIGRLGLNHGEVEQSFRSSVAGASPANRKARGASEKYGLGLQYALNDNFQIRGEWEHYGLDNSLVLKDDVDVYSLGVVYRFGRRPAPAPVVQAPAPTPAPPPAPAPSLPMEVTLSASTLFDFDRSELRAAGRQALDALVRDMQDLDYEVVIVTGHTDRIGTRNYNLALSQRRADAVRSYLTQAGIPAASITTRAVNSDQPVTRPEQCTGPVSDALKACLQPDRRVVIEVTGMLDPE